VGIQRAAGRAVSARLLCRRRSEEANQGRARPRVCAPDETGQGCQPAKTEMGRFLNACNALKCRHMPLAPTPRKRSSAELHSAASPNCIRHAAILPDCYRPCRNLPTTRPPLPWSAGLRPGVPRFGRQLFPSCPGPSETWFPPNAALCRLLPRGTRVSQVPDGVPPVFRNPTSDSRHLLGASSSRLSTWRAPPPCAALCRLLSATPSPIVAARGRLVGKMSHVNVVMPAVCRHMPLAPTRRAHSEAPSLERRPPARHAPPIGPRPSETSVTPKAALCRF